MKNKYHEIIHFNTDNQGNAINVTVDTVDKVIFLEVKSLTDLKVKYKQYVDFHWDKDIQGLIENAREIAKTWKNMTQAELEQKFQEHTTRPNKIRTASFSGRFAEDFEKYRSINLCIDQPYPAIV